MSKINRKKISTFLIISILVNLSIITLISPFVRGTTVFSNGFEDGYNSWTGIDDDGVNTVEISTVEVYGGVNSSKVVIKTNNPGYEANVYKYLGSEHSTIYYRSYIKFTVINLPDGNNFAPLVIGQDDSNARANIYVTNSSGTLYWGIKCVGDDVNTSTTSLTLNNWNSIEMEYQPGKLELWINGTSVATLTGQTTYSDIDYVFAGVAYTTTGSSGSTFYIDNVVISDEYIGPTFSSREAGNTDEIAAYSSVLYCHWVSEIYDLNNYSVYHNNTGTWISINGSLSGSDDWSNETITLNSTVGLVIQYYFWANNSEGETWTTDNYTLTTRNALPPDYYWNSVWVNETTRGQPCSIVVQWYSTEGNLSHATLQHNNTGTVINTTISVSEASTAWANFSITLNSTYKLIQWKMYANNSYGQETNTFTFEIHNYTVSPFHYTKGNNIYWIDTDLEYIPKGFFQIWGADTPTGNWYGPGDSEGNYDNYVDLNITALTHNIEAMIMYNATMMSTYYIWENWVVPNKWTASDLPVYNPADINLRESLNHQLSVAEAYNFTFNIRPYNIVSDKGPISDSNSNSTAGGSFNVTSCGTNSSYAGSGTRQFTCTYNTSAGTLSHYDFGTNETGSWVWEGWTDFPGTPTEYILNVTRDMELRAGEWVQYTFKANRTDATQLDITRTFKMRESRPSAPYAPYHKGNIVTGPSNYVDKYLDMVYNLSAYRNVWFHPYDEPTSDQTNLFTAMSEVICKMRGAGIRHIYNWQWAFCGDLGYVDTWVSNTTHWNHKQNVVIAPHIYRRHGSYNDTAYGFDPQAAWTYDQVYDQITSQDTGYDQLGYDHVLNTLGFPIMVAATGPHYYSNTTKHWYDYTSFNSTLTVLEDLGIGFCAYQWDRYAASLFRLQVSGTSIRYPNEGGRSVLWTFFDRPGVFSMGNETASGHDGYYLYGNNTEWEEDWDGETLNVTYTLNVGDVAEVRIVWNYTGGNPINSTLKIIHSNSSTWNAEDYYDTPTGMIRINMTGSSLQWFVIGYESSSGWTGIIIGITNPSKIMGIDVSGITKVNEIS